MKVKWFLVGDVEDPRDMASSHVTEWLVESDEGKWITNLGLVPSYSLSICDPNEPFTRCWVVNIYVDLEPEMETFYTLKFGGYVQI